jgi:hypothetical protein
MIQCQLRCCQLYLFSVDEQLQQLTKKMLIHCSNNHQILKTEISLAKNHLLDLVTFTSSVKYAMKLLKTLKTTFLRPT